ncbi:MAG TPA: hypothetical protein VHB50_10630 [Bryobacteraceae bacterium]|nr:hypothetical protein [Bryobacteraceae bacterium]
MKKITSAVLGLSLSLAVAGLSFAAQAPATKDSGATTAPVKKHSSKKHSRKAANTAMTPAAPATNAK